jgi:hypothetical protein
MATADEVAAWMYGEFARAGKLTQVEAVEGIRAHFGGQYAPGGRIRQDVLRAFRRLEPAGRIWVGSAGTWRRRSPDDPRLRGRANRSP